ncbi:polyketide synthase dehydratase-domain-containing protein [Xylariaceae sp. FL0255]|nr:polyketide synthase dehydratase-domain-containing protein [Xylariaceae sp. FL0255]
MFSSTTGGVINGALGPAYWVRNMVWPVLFSGAVKALLSSEDTGADCLLEIGPSNGLAGPVNQVKKANGHTSTEVLSAWKRGPVAIQTLLGSVGSLFNMGVSIRIAPFNEDDEPRSPKFITDLPNYSWDHSIKYWHDKIIGTPWARPIWKNVLKIKNLTWMADHVLGESVIFPGAGYIAMAIEAIYPKKKATGELPAETIVNNVTYRLRDVTFPWVLTIDQNEGTKMLLSLETKHSSKDSWHEFNIASISKDTTSGLEEHCHGLIY